MGKTIMIVDDSISMRQLVSFTLQSEGFTVVEAADGPEAVEKSQSTDVDMFITDLNMPEMDGIELIRQLKADSRHRFSPIVMLTTESHESKKQEGKQAGAAGWIVKPFTPDELLHIVQKFAPMDTAASTR
jgi:two-component system chemotaxis response regulator CheY